MSRAASAFRRATLFTTLVGLAACAAGTPEATPVPAPSPPSGPEAIERPLPGPIVPPPPYRQALDEGTRSPDGSPGPGYWQQWAEYDIHAELDPVAARLTGSETIRYHNRSPNRLPALVLHLYQNLHAEGTVRNEAQEVTGGVELERVVVDGTALREGPLNQGAAWAVQATVMMVRLPEPLEPGATATLEIDWSFTVPQSGAGRMGWSDREMYYLGYWFPKMAVYDDLRGWDAQPYLGGAEFYDGFGDYRLHLTVPEGWTVMATGELENPEEVFTAQTRARLAEAARADGIVHVATREDREGNRVTASTADGTLTYHFTARNVRDVAWTASDVQLWDATSAYVPERDGGGADDRVLIHAFWREDRAPLWADQALYGKHAIEFHSAYTAIPYPWPHMTSVEGADIIGGGMEFPMLTIIGPYLGSTAQALYNVTSHELAHMWVPMIVGTNENRHAWMDEGFTTFLENQSRPDYWPDAPSADSLERLSWLQVARVEMEQPLMRHGDYYEPGPGYGVASYPKQATLLATLRTLLGEEDFLSAYRAYLSEWRYKHPAPWDYFNTFERVAGRDLDWFWWAFYYETWRMDQAVAAVEYRDGAPVIVIEDEGWAPMPVRVRIETTDGGVLERELPVDVWLRGRTRAEIELPASVGRVTRVEIDPGHLLPDVDRSDNVWTP